MDVEQILEPRETLPCKDGGEICLSALKSFIKKLGKNHNLAIKLWGTKNKAAREITVKIAEPKKQMKNFWRSG